MKIAILSPNQHNLKEYAKRLSRHRVVTIEGGKNRMSTVADEERPDLILVEGMCGDTAELVHVEEVTMRYPSVAVILLCANLSPEFLLNAMRAGVREVLPSPAEAEALDAAVGRVASKALKNGTSEDGKVLAFVPCKGGSGATFFATNLGHELAKKKSVLVIDLNLQFGDALSFVHDGKPSSTLADLSRDIGRLDASLLSASTVKISDSYHVLPGPEDPAQAMEIKPEQIASILKLATSEYDFVLLDMPRTLDILSIRALDHAYRIYPVLQLSLAHLRNAGKLLTAFKSLGYEGDRLEIIVNRYEKSGDIALEDMRRTLGPVPFRTIPNCYKEVASSINHGYAVSEKSRSSAVARSLDEMVLSLNPKLEAERSIFQRIFKRA